MPACVWEELGSASVPAALSFPVHALEHLSYSFTCPQDILTWEIPTVAYSGQSTTACMTRT